MVTREKLLEENTLLKLMVHQLSKENASLKSQLDEKKEMENVLRMRSFGKKSEVHTGQLSLFNLPSDTSFPNAETTESQTVAKTTPRPRKKTLGKREALLSKCQTIEQHHTLANEERQRVCCGHEMSSIGIGKTVNELVYIPAKCICVKHCYEHFKCNHCHDAHCDHCAEHNDHNAFVATKAKRLPLKNSLCSASLMAHIIQDHYEYSLPFYRIEKRMKELNVSIPRNVLVNWNIQCALRYFKPLVDTMHQRLLQAQVLHADETPYQVNKSDKKKHYMWLFVTGDIEEYPIAIFHATDSRSGEIPKDFLTRFKGYLHCDGYAGYHKVPNVSLVGCIAHLRRKFHEAAKATKGVSSKIANQALSWLGQLFALEKDYTDKGYTLEERCIARQHTSHPIFQQFKEWAQDISLGVSDKSLLGKAFQYLFNQQQKFDHIFRDGRLELTNNRSERAIKSIVMIRKNSLFADSVDGHRANGIVMSIIATAKMNGLDVGKYIEYLLTELPNHPEALKNGTLEAYLPWSEIVQQICRKDCDIELTTSFA